MSVPITAVSSTWSTPKPGESDVRLGAPGPNLDHRQGVEDADGADRARYAARAAPPPSARTHEPVRTRPGVTQYSAVMVRCVLLAWTTAITVPAATLEQRTTAASPALMWTKPLEQANQVPLARLSQPS